MVLFLAEEESYLLTKAKTMTSFSCYFPTKLPLFSNNVSFPLPKSCIPLHIGINLFLQCSTQSWRGSTVRSAIKFFSSQKKSSTQILSAFSTFWPLAFYTGAHFHGTYSNTYLRTTTTLWTGLCHCPECYWLYRRTDLLFTAILLLTFSKLP